LTKPDITDFITQNIIGKNTTAWEIENTTPIPTTGEIGLLKQLDVFDKYVFDQMLTSGNAEGYFGQFYINDLVKGEKYETVLLLNSTAQDIVGAWGAYAHEAMLKQYFRDKGIPMAATWNMKIVDYPFPLSKLF